MRGVGRRGRRTPAKEKTGPAIVQYPDACLRLRRTIHSTPIMDNNHLNALLQRDTDTVAGLLADQPHYPLLEDDIAPLRTEHAKNLAEARTFEGSVLDESQDDSTQQKKAARKQLKVLGSRLGAALQAYAASAANPDEDLPGRVNITETDLIRADDTTFASLLGKLLAEGKARPQELAKREFTADDLTLTGTLLERFTRKRTGQRISAVAGSTDRNRLMALLRRNGNLIKLLRQQLRPYKNSPTKHDVWLRFQGYTRVIERGGGGAAAPAPAQPQA